MKSLRNYYKSLTERVWHRNEHKQVVFLTITFWVVLFLIFYFNTFHEKYPDEFDNILGGKLILSGVFPYSGFFSHHGPVAYFVAGFVQLFTGFSFVAFRIGYSILLFSLTLGTYLFLRRSVSVNETRFYYIFAFLLGCASTYYWLHMLLADSLSAFLILPVFGILFLKMYYQKMFTIVDFVVISIFMLLTLLTAVTYIYVALVVYVMTFIVYKTNNRKNIVSKDTGIFILIFALPPVVFLLYLLLTGSLNQYIDQSLVFNQKYYIYNYPGAEQNGINPLRYALITFQNFMNDYRSLFVQIPHLNFAFPINVTWAVGNIVLLVYLTVKKKFTPGIFLLLVLIFSNMRSSPVDSAEKDYPAAVYVITSLFSLCFVISKLYQELGKNYEFNKKIIFSALFLLTSVYFLATSLALYSSASQKIFAKYMGTSPLIYDRPEVAPVLNRILMPGQTVWMGPLEFEEMYYTNSTLPTKYHFLIPAMGRSPQAQEEIIKELSENKPDYLWFNRNFAVLGDLPKDYAPFFLEFVEKNYTPLGEVETNNQKYKSLIPRTDSVDLEAKLFLRNDKQAELLDNLNDKQFIEKAE